MPGPEYLQAIVLGVVQGLAEFLPISSSGHLVIIGTVMQDTAGRAVDTESNLQLNVALHVGTLFSILWVYRADLPQVIRGRRMCLAIGLATLPLIVVAVTPLKDLLKSTFETPLVAGIGLLVTAAFLVAGQRIQANKHRLDEIPLAGAAIIGLFQAVALVPGISRSGSTISAGLLTGLKRDAATSFSFIIAIPAIMGAAILMGKDILEGEAGGHSAGVLAVGAFVSFLVGLVALRWLRRLVAEQKLHWFAWYCASVGLATILWQSLP